MLVIDRIEGAYAICETAGRVMASIPLTELPPGVREGDCLRVQAGHYTIDKEETLRRRKASAELLRRLLERTEE